MIENFINNIFSFAYLKIKKEKEYANVYLYEKLVKKSLSIENENEYLSLLKNGISLIDRSYLFKNYSSKKDFLNNKTFN